MIGILNCDLINILFFTWSHMIPDTKTIHSWTITYFDMWTKVHLSSITKTMYLLFWVSKWTKLVDQLLSWETWLICPVWFGLNNILEKRNLRNIQHFNKNHLAIYPGKTWKCSLNIMYWLCAGWIVSLEGRSFEGGPNALMYFKIVPLLLPLGFLKHSSFTVQRHRLSSED